METGLLSCIESRVEKNGNLYAQFELGAFASGQALTFANALRRTLLSEITGLAIVAVEIQGVKHEYSNFLGMKESVLDFLLNLKKVVLTTDSICIQPQIGSLFIQGPTVVRAGDLKLPTSLVCVNPDQYLATLAINGVIQLTFYVCQGKNSSNVQFFYAENLNFESQKNMFEFTTFHGKSKNIFIENFINQQKKTTGTLLDLEPIFMPVKKVNFLIQPQEKSKNFCEKIILEIWTTGSIQPTKALSQAIKELLFLFSSFQPSYKLKLNFLRINLKTFVRKNIRFSPEKHFFCLDIANLNLSLRSYTFLKRLNINTIGDLIEYSNNKSFLFKKLGKRSFKEIKKNLSQRGFFKNF